jgi:3-isopropylmalate/(R)-2-methylmalate dehydratase small subunit
VKALRRVTGKAAVLDRADVDTDQIMPKQFLKRVERTGFGEFLFFDWAKDPDFELNRPEYEGARVLVTGRNFGSGSSREHAPWALLGYGFRAVLSTSFADIFRNNALKNGLLPIALPAQAHASLAEMIAADPNVELAVDLGANEVRLPDGSTFGFEVDPFSKRMLLEGTDELGFLLAQSGSVAAYEAAHPQRVDTTAPTGA